MPVMPASFAAAGYQTADQIKRRRLMISIDGPPDSGKSEFSLSAPGPGIDLILDRGIEKLLDNKTPPKTRRSDFMFKVIEVPLATQAAQPKYVEYWQAFYEEYLKAVRNPDARTVVLDGDSDSWELQRLAEFGRLHQVPPNLYNNVNAARRAMLARAFDSKKNIIFTNRVKKHYEDVLDPVTGKVKLNNQGTEVREWDGTYEYQGFSDRDYLFQVHLQAFYDAEQSEYGVRIEKCKSDMNLHGLELRGADCNFAGLVQTIYPEVPLKEWGL